MKQRITTGWTLQRALFVIVGTFVMAQGASEQLWFGVIFGAYFTSMGLFAFGCAAGGCFGGACEIEQPETSTKLHDVSINPQ
jgi:hypothetical protein